MEAISISGPRPRSDVLYAMERARDERIEAALAEHRARSVVGIRAATCPSCGADEYDTEVSPPYCPRCGYSGLTRNSHPVAQRSAHPCPGCQVPTTADRCDWCKRWETLEARATARFGTITERELSQLGTAGGW